MSEQLDVWLHDATLGVDVLVGSLVRASGRGQEVIRFTYSPQWLSASNKHAFQIDPELPLTPGVHFPSGGRSLSGIFRDTAPDRWGRVLMERREAMEARQQSRASRRLGEWDFLCGVGDVSRMGALRLWDAQRQAYVDDRDLSAPPATRLRELEAIVRELDADDAQDKPEYEHWLRLLVLPGSGLGGARPKASFVDEAGSLWLAKFPASDDRRDVGGWEFLAHDLARKAGLELPDAQLLQFASPHHTFCVKRFDRSHGSRRLYCSAMTLLQRNDGDSGSYLEIAQALQDHGDMNSIRPGLAQLYRRIAFSIVIGNRDDHFRNHGFLRAATGWSLAPAFDINPNPDKAEHALAIDEADASPSMAVLRATAPYYQLDEGEAAAIENEVRNAVVGWQARAEALGLPQREIVLMERVIDASS